MDINAGDDFQGLCHQRCSYTHMSNFGQLQSNGHLKLKIEGRFI